MKELRICKHHGETPFGKQRRGDSYSYYCVACSSARQARWRKRNKAIAVAYKGGACAACGYSRCLDALHFHHTDPSLKDFDKFSRFTLAAASAELDKCILLCANCHAEAHAVE